MRIRAAMLLRYYVAWLGAAKRLLPRCCAAPLRVAIGMHIFKHPLYVAYNMGMYVDVKIFEYKFVLLPHEVACSAYCCRFV